MRFETCQLTYKIIFRFFLVFKIFECRKIHTIDIWFLLRKMVQFDDFSIHGKTELKLTRNQGLFMNYFQFLDIVCWKTKKLTNQSTLASSNSFYEYEHLFRVYVSMSNKARVKILTKVFDIIHISYLFNDLSVINIFENNWWWNWDIRCQICYIC